MTMVKIYVNPGGRYVDKAKLDALVSEWGVEPAILVWEVHSDSERAVEDALNKALGLNEEPIIVGKGMP